MTDRKAALESQLTQIAGLPIEVTVRGDRAFTFSFEGQCEAAVAAVVKFFGSFAKMAASYDHECDFTCIYADV